MMDFAAIGLPRSGTTWAANWLTDGGALCLHDPIEHHAPADVLALDPGRRWGVSCTGLFVFEEVMREIAERCPVVVLERDPAQSAALADGIGMGLPDELHEWIHERFARAPGVRVPHTDLWDEAGARRVWSILRPGEAFDVWRWRMLRDIQMQPFIDRIDVCAETVAAFRDEYSKG